MGEDQKGTSEDPKGIREGVEGSKGDLRVVLLPERGAFGDVRVDRLLGLQLLDVAEVTATNVASLALIVFATTYVTVLR